MPDALVASTTPIKSSMIFHHAAEILKGVNEGLGKERLFSEKIKVSKLRQIVDDKRRQFVAKINMIREMHYSPASEETLRKCVDEKIDSAIDEYFSENKMDNENKDEYKDGETKGSAKVMRDHNHFKSDPSAPDISQ